MVAGAVVDVDETGGGVCILLALLALPAEAQPTGEVDNVAQRPTTGPIRRACCEYRCLSHKMEGENGDAGVRRWTVRNMALALDDQLHCMCLA